MKIIAIANQKGGVGKTTTAINLSTCLAVAGARVLLLDLDPQGNASSGLGHRAAEGQSLYSVLTGDDPLEGKIQTTRFENLSIIPAQMELAGCEVELVRSANHLVRLREVLEPLKRERRFDYLLIDCPPSLGILMTSALAAADGLLIPMQCEYFGLEGLARIVDIHDQIATSGINPSVTLEGILMTMYDGRTSHCRAVVEEVRRAFADLVYPINIPRSIAVAESQSFEKALLEYDPHGKASQAYKQIAEIFLSRQDPTAAPASAPIPADRSVPTAEALPPPAGVPI
ncbi:MAG: Cobyrinic acid ac-diamide synthase [Verrucomicrobiales bacterium]|nr:Cobyrinic acid ac-diamide synthase [Verrucomicrobiales bacterium]